jgi:hypothetical protein
LTQLVIGEFFETWDEPLENGLWGAPPPLPAAAAADEEEEAEEVPQAEQLQQQQQGEGVHGLPFGVNAGVDYPHLHQQQQQQQGVAAQGLEGLHALAEQLQQEQQHLQPPPAPPALTNHIHHAPEYPPFDPAVDTFQGLTALQQLDIDMGDLLLYAQQPALPRLPQLRELRVEMVIDPRLSHAWEAAGGVPPLPHVQKLELYTNDALTRGWDKS